MAGRMIRSMEHIGRCAGEAAESSTSGSAGSRKREVLVKSHPQWHTSSNEATPPNPFQVVPLPDD